jgi:hypothetical protein
MPLNLVDGHHAPWWLSEVGAAHQQDTKNIEQNKLFSPTETSISVTYRVGIFFGNLAKNLCFLISKNINSSGARAPHAQVYGSP